MVCLVVNHFLSLSAVALAGAAANNVVVLPKKFGRYFIDTWSLLASFWGFQRTQSGHIWGGPNMSCWKGDALNIDLFGSTAFWGRIGEQNRHTCHWNTTTPANAAAALDCYLPKPSDWTSGFFSFTDATADFSQEMGSWRVTSLKKYLTASLLVPRIGTRLLSEKSKVSYGQIAKFTLLLKTRRDLFWNTMIWCFRALKGKPFTTAYLLLFHSSFA